MDLFYLPPQSEFRHLIGKENITYSLEKPFKKMSFHNRAIIPSANGLINLTVPVQGGREVKGNLADILIDNKQDWQIRHWRTITSAYGRSPWFEYYEPGFRPYFFQEYLKLWNWNADLLTWTCKMLGLTITIENNTLPPTSTISLIRPSNFQKEPFTDGLRSYTQVFQDRLGFQPNVSIIDLLFNEGKQGIRLITP